MDIRDDLREKLKPYSNNYSDLGYCRSASEIISQYIQKNINYSIKLFEKEEIEQRIDFFSNVIKILDDTIVEMSRFWQADSDNKDLLKARSIISDIHQAKDRIISEFKILKSDLWNITHQEDTKKQSFYQKWEVWLAVIAIILGILGIIF